MRHAGCPMLPIYAEPENRVSVPVRKLYAISQDCTALLRVLTAVPRWTSMPPRFYCGKL